MNMGRLQVGAFILSLLALQTGIATCRKRVAQAPPRALFVLGDSYADTGNHNKSNPLMNIPWRFPYGLTWPGTPTGRFSNGRVLTDFVAGFLKLPLPVAYQNRQNGRPNSGINFAYGGSGVFPTFGPDYITISGQIEQLKNVSYSTRFLSQSAALLVVAGNDYVIYSLKHRNNKGVESFVVEIVKEIGVSVGTLYQLGFRNVALTLIEPFGCVPTTTQLNNYTSCITSNNDISLLHNNLVHRKIIDLRRHFKDLNIIPLDLYSTFSSILHAHSGHNVSSRRNMLRPCCEGKVVGASCGTYSNTGLPLFTVCENPHHSFFWDTFHPTEQGWRHVTTRLKPSLRKLKLA